MKLFVDTETRSPIPISAGAWKYHEASEVLLVPYAIDDGPVRVWEPVGGTDAPLDFLDAIYNSDCEIVVHNIGFDWPALHRLQHVRLAQPALERWHCTMAQAYLHGLPGSLDHLCELYKLTDKAKLKTGKDLVKLFCLPGRFRNRQWADWESHPEQWEAFKAYAMQDVEATRELYKRLPKWNLTRLERRRFLADFRIQMRGVPVDVELAQSVVEAVEAEKQVLARQTSEMTQGKVLAATQRDKLLDYVTQELGLDIPDLRASTLEQLVNDQDVPNSVRELLRIRLDASTNSVAKYKTLLKSVGVDGRLRGIEQYRGASRTGRQAHRMFQPGNLPRPQIKKAEIPLAIELFKAGKPDLIPSVMPAAASCIRGCIVPSEGNVLCVGDWANIEGRLAAWIAGEEWKVEAYRAYDRGEGPDLYKLAFSQAFAIPLDQVDDWGRQVGKVMELFLQYGGGVGAFVTGAATYGIDLADMAARASPFIPEDVREEAERMHAWWTGQMKKSDYGLAPSTFMACDALKRMWRRKHPKIVQRWSDLESWCMEAVVSRASTGTVSTVKNWVRLKLPSGRFLSYPAMRLGKDKREEGEEVEAKYSLIFDGVNSRTRAWGPIYTHGGTLFENEIQAAAADVLHDCRVRMEMNDERFAIVMDVHDEIVAEGEPSQEDAFQSLMECVPAWASGMPLAAGVFSTDRYRKG